MSIMSKTICYQFPMLRRDGEKYIAQFLLPADLSQAEADRVCAFVGALVVPWSVSETRDAEAPR